MQDQSREAILRHIADLKERDGEVVAAAQKALIEAGTAAIPPLVELITGPDLAPIRWHGAEVLGRMGASAVPTLITLAGHNSPLVRRMAIEALRMTGDERGIPVMQAALNDESGRVREGAAAALGSMGIATIPQIVRPEKPIPSTPVLSPTRFSDCFRLMAWYFFAEGSYDEIRRSGRDDLLRDLAALPVSVLVWIPLLILMAAILFGVVTLFDDWGSTLGLILAMPLGWMLTWLMGRTRIEDVNRDLGRLKAMAFAILVVTAGFVVYSEMKFATVTFVQLGPRIGLIIIGSQLLALAIAIGIGMNMEVNLPVIIPGLAGLILGLFAPSTMNVDSISLYLWGGIILASIGIAILPAYLVHQILQRFPNMIVRQAFLSLAFLLNMVLIWLLLFGGWEVLYNPVV